MSKTSIFYFSGTGNSLFIAKKIADSIEGSSIHRMASFKATDQIGGRNEKIGFVFPSYYGNLPRIVKKFVNKLDIHPETWIFGIITMGAPFGYGSITSLKKALAEKGLRLNYGNGILMPANYILKYDPPSSMEAAVKYNKKAEKRIKHITGDIKNKKSKVRNSFIIANDLYKNIERLDKNFFVENQCTGCRTCEKICPVKNIIIIDGHPKWQHHCEHCVACIQWCPQKAIQYGTKTKSHKRYHNPAIKLADLIE